MEPSDLEKMVEAALTVWSSRDLETVLSFVTDDCVYEDVTPGIERHGKAALLDFLPLAFAFHPDLKIEVTNRFVAGDPAGAEWVASGTQLVALGVNPVINKGFSIRVRPFLSSTGQAWVLV